ncbi:bifunctional isocitrate dehydrogenase kinase/phosphatase [Advenella sp. RU8]|uniref:bifunctional isocitrate dehydrogenase kinase/phosphatase n=1 Tax=Advenella sp. RU8 TaxID=3399575 RepID=UPI003AAF0883
MTYIADHQLIQQLDKTLPPPAEVAKKILAGFDRHYSLFRYVAQRAKALFESHDWHGIQRVSKERIEYYDIRVRECTYQVNHMLNKTQGMPQEKHGDLTPQQISYWQSIKQEFVRLLTNHKQPECAETFFNSVTCRILHRDYFHNAFLFVRPAIATEYLDSENQSYRVYYPHIQGIEKSIIKMVADYGLAAPFKNLPYDARKVARMAVGILRKKLISSGGKRIAPDCQIHVLNTLFFRNKGAYIVGRFINNNIVYPFGIPLLHTAANEIELDAFLSSTDDISTLFSFTRAYFLVDMEVPSAYVAFLSSLLPSKPKAELYTAIGLQKQGKTLFYRDFLYHLNNSHDQFDIAPGIKGMVMTVFTLPSYPYVFKLIRDRINKEGMTHEIVMKKYHMVKMHDRVGRMADTWEYSLVALPRKRCSPELLEELRNQVPKLIEETEDSIVIRHVYIERRMTPLNIFLSQANDEALDNAIKGYGDAIAELAAANIFAGDMLFKNFGVTRLGRIVFYDYDEIQPMREMNFRAIPTPPNEEAEMSGEPWYPIHANDVFPEEFERFLLGNPRVRAAFMKHHPYLLDYKWWQTRKDRVAAGKIEDIFPYPSSRRLHVSRPELTNQKEL